MLHVNEPQECHGGILVRCYDSDTDIDIRYWFDKTTDGRTVLCGEVHENNGIRHYEDDMTLLNEVAEKVCTHMGTTRVYDLNANKLYEQ